MYPMAELVEGKLTFETPGGHPFTFDTLKDLHSRALMLGIPTHATITHVAWHTKADPNLPQQMTVYWRVLREPPTPPAGAERSPFVPTQPPNPYPNPITTQE